nr:alpha-glucan family phosphorylase [Acanthopleuribacter pedis]
MKPFTVLNLLPASLRRLRELAYNLWWSWHPSAAELFAELDNEAWHESGHNPVEMLDSVPQETLNNLAQDPVFLQRLDDTLARFDAYQGQRTGPRRPEVAYISYQFTLHECLPLFFSSAGTIAGDTLKSAGDLDFPMVGLSLAFHHGTPTQRFDLQGNFHGEFRESDFTSQPIRPLKQRDGSLFTIRIAFPGRRVTLQVWRVEVGAVSLYLLDSDHHDNSDQDRLITRHCNPTDPETRLQQCMILGVGSRHLLQELDIKPKIWHLNDCHGAFLTFSRAAQLVHKENLPFDAALAYIRETTLMTVYHAGHDEESHQGTVFDEDTIRPYFNLYRHSLSVSWQHLTALGAQPDPQRRNRFSLNLLGIRSAGKLTAKNQTHRAQIQRKLQPLAAGYHASELPISQVTEGVHPTSWITPDLLELLNTSLGADWTQRGPGEVDFDLVTTLPEKDIRRAKLKAKARLLHEVRRHLEHTWHHRRDSPSLLTKIIGTMRDDALIIGFTHHLALNPRANLLFRDTAHLARLLNQEDRPVIILFASHILPGTLEAETEAERKQAEKLVKDMFHLSRREEFLGRLIFLENFDLFLNRMLVQGCDLWLNAPSNLGNYDMLSGIMAAANGALNLSVPDGWWVEADNGKNGWTIGKNLPVANRDYRDEFDSQHLYLLLEQNLIPLYFHECMIGPSQDWLDRGRRAMAQVIGNFSSHRLLREYNQRFYQTMLDRRDHFLANHYDACGEKARRHDLFLAGWQRLAILETHVEGLREESVCHGMDVHVEVHLRHENLPAEMLRVEFVSGVRDHNNHLHELIVYPLQQAEDKGTESRWRGIYVPMRNGPKAYGIRVRPNDESLDLSFPLVKWAR